MDATELETLVERSGLSFEQVHVAAALQAAGYTSSSSTVTIPPDTHNIIHKVRARSFAPPFMSQCGGGAPSSRVFVELPPWCCAFLRVASLRLSPLPSAVQVVENDLAVPDWSDFTDFVSDLYSDLKMHETGGANATYIPVLAEQDPSWFGVSICTVDG